MGDLEKYRRGHHGLATRRTFIDFYLLFFLIQFGFHLFSTGSSSGDGYWGMRAELLQGYNVLCVVVGAFHFVVGYQNLLLLCVFGFVCGFRGDLLCCKN